jgi:RimJ/RimL family protein N-acetyltransferase
VKFPDHLSLWAQLKSITCDTCGMIWWPTEVPTLQYGLITLRKPEERDIVPLFEGVQDPIIPQFTRIPANYQMANAEHYVRERSPNGFTMRTELQLALEYDGKFAGALSFHTLDLDSAKAEIGYWLTAEVRGKGVATAATRLLTEYGFESIGFHRIEALVVSSNVPSLKVLKNAGYMQEGIKRDACCQDDGTREDMVLFAAIRTDWGR